MDSFNSSTSENLSKSLDGEYTIILAINVLVMTFSALISISGFLGNALVIFVVLANPKMRNVSNILIMNLALSDLLFLVSALPYSVSSNVFFSLTINNFWCKTLQYFMSVSIHGNCYSLVLMTLDRFLAVIYPIGSILLRTEENAYGAVLIVWIGCLILGASDFFCFGVEPGDLILVEPECGFIRGDRFGHGCNAQAYQVSFFLTSYVVPLALICGLYMTMLARLWSGAAPGEKYSLESRLGKKRVAKIVLIIVAIFTLCWGPLQILGLVFAFNEDFQYTESALITQLVLGFLPFFNSCINPLIYAFLCQNFRRSFRNVFFSNSKQLFFGLYTKQFMVTASHRTYETTV